MPKPLHTGPNSIDTLAALPSPRAWAVIIVLSLVLLGLAVYWLYEALLPIAVALGLAYACSPMVDSLQKRGWDRGWSVAFILAMLGLGLSLALALVVPSLVSDGRDLMQRFPDYASLALDKVLQLGQRLGLELPEREAVLDKLRTQLGRWTGTLASSGLVSAQGLLERASGLLSSALNLLLVPVFFFFFLRDLPKTRVFLKGLIPPRLRPLVSDVAATILKAFSGYLRGQAMVSLILAAIFATALSLLGVKYGLVIGLLAGLLNIIPYVGQATGLLLALTMALVDFGGWGRVLALPALFAAVNFIEGTFITPRIVGEHVGLSPLQAMLALVLGAAMAGLLGLVLAIPLAGALKALLLDLDQVYRGSRLFLGPGRPARRR